LMVTDAEAPSRLVEAALELLKDKDKQQELAENMRKIARPDAAEHIAREVISLIEDR